jgi:hypothetical protein
MADSHRRAKLRKTEERIRNSVLQNLAVQQTSNSSTTPISIKSKALQLLDSNVFWGGIGVLVGSTAASFSRIAMLCTSWAIVSLAIIKVSFFQTKRRLVIIGGNAVAALLVGLAFLIVWRMLPKPTTSPSLDQAVDISVERVIKRFPWMATGPTQHTEIITVPTKPPPQHTHAVFVKDVITDATQPPFARGMQPAMNIGFTNGGDFAIKDGVLRAVVVVIPGSEMNKIFNRYQSKIRLSTAVRGGDVPGHDPLWRYHTFFGPELTDANVTNLSVPASDQKEVLCGLGILRWQDDTGEYETDHGGCYVKEPDGSWNWHELLENNRETTLRSK